MSPRRYRPVDGKDAPFIGVSVTLNTRGHTMAADIECGVIGISIGESANTAWTKAKGYHVPIGPTIEGLQIANIITSAGPDPVVLSVDSVGKSIAGVKIKGEGNDLVLDTSSFYNPTEVGAYPTALGTYTIVCSKYPDSQIAPAVRSFLTVALGKGQEGLTDNGYIPVPDAFKSRLTTAVDAIS